MIDFSDLGTAELPLRFFLEFTKIPRGSGHCSKIADYLVNFANERELFVYRDERDNVIIKKPATVGFENKPTVIIQGHTDIVCEKLDSSDIDMLSVGPRIFRDGDFLRADGSTLGADDGVALAYMLALLDSSEIFHPKIEAVFTSDEETGLIGASHLDFSILTGKTMINIDSDEEGVFTAGCAGGLRADISLPVCRRENCSHKAYKLSISGLIGGHSGIEIDKNRENAIKLLAKMLSRLSVNEIFELSGGNADNAIPRDAYAVFASEGIGDKENAFLDSIISDIRINEPNAKYSLSECKAPGLCADRKSSEGIISLINNEPSGVISMSADIPELVETSLNLGIARLDAEKLTLSFSLRSSDNAKKEKLAEEVIEIAKRLGATVNLSGNYPGWNYKKNSHLRDVMSRLYREMYGVDAKVVIIHAGLECGLFSDKIEGLDCISIGPDNFSIHTPDEHLSLSSFKRVWEYLIELLKRI